MAEKWWRAAGPGIFEGDQCMGVMVSDELAQRAAQGLNLLECMPQEPSLGNFAPASKLQDFDLGDDTIVFACGCNQAEAQHGRGDAGFCRVTLEARAGA